MMFSQTVTSPLHSVADVAIRFDCQHLFCVEISVAISESFSPGNLMKKSCSLPLLARFTWGGRLIDVYHCKKNQYCYIYTFISFNCTIIRIWIELNSFFCIFSFSIWFHGTNWCRPCSSSARPPFLLQTTKPWGLSPGKRTRIYYFTISVRSLNFTARLILPLFSALKSYERETSTVQEGKLPVILVKQVFEGANRLVCFKQTGCRRFRDEGETEPVRGVDTRSSVCLVVTFR